MIVIAVIAVLATVLVPAFGDVIGSAGDSAARQEAKNAYTSYMISHAAEGVRLDYCLYEMGSRFVTMEHGTPTGFTTISKTQ